MRCQFLLTKKQKIRLQCGGNVTIRRKTKMPGQIVIDLTGPDGNAFYLMGVAEKFCKTLGMDSDKIISEMQSGDYENLLKVFDSYFGSFVILER